MAFSDHDGLTADYLSWLDGLCAALLDLEQNQCPEAFQGRGLVIPEAQVTAALSGQCPVEPVPGFDLALADLLERGRTSRSPLAQLIVRLAPEGPELLALLLALAPCLNRKYERVFGYLQDDAAARSATAGLCADLWALVAGEDSFTSLDDPRRPLNRYVLEPGGSGLSRPLVLRESALLLIQELDYLPAALEQICEVIPPAQPPALLTNEELVARASHFAACCLSGGSKPSLLQLYGPAGTGKRFTLCHVGAALERPVLLLDCRAWSELEEPRRTACLKEMAAWVWLHGGIPALYRFADFPGLGPAEQSRLAQSLLSPFREDFPLTILCGEKPLQLRQEACFRSLHITIPDTSIRQQQQFWATFSQAGPLPLAPELQPQQLATLYSLSAGQISQVLELAQADALARQQAALDRDAISQGVRLLCSHSLRELTEPMALSFTWDDLEVSDQARTQLRELCDRIRCRWQVNEEWGFNRRLPYGKGVSVCLYGPPGTGKTMTAQVLAREFGLDAYRVDMSRILDKYIGETEKKLGELFDAAKDSNSVLFFDEADALFAKRTEVGDSKDRYANVETAYLLQRMEQHNGISILATNAVGNFDEAFKRRISYMISLPMPDAETRKRLWHKVFPQEAPLVNVDLDALAERFELTGSSIKNAALHAAYLAAAQDQPITRRELVRAIQNEYQKTGRILMEHELY